MRAAKCRPQRGVQRGLPLALLGNFQRYGVLRLGKFPNKLRYFLRKYPAACRLPAFRLWLSLPSAYPYNPTLFFPFRSVGGVPAVCPCLIGSAVESALCTWLSALVVLTLPTIPNPTLLFFLFGRWWAAGAVVSVFKGFFARGGRMQGLGEEYYPKHEGGDCSPNGVAARPCSRRKAPCLLRLCKRE